ncbi:hypothetical protein AQJ67_28855 [Streptomyces caeruleatus]|uniref:Uncharacterized protein n=1 Tax=Streptomyces caeruleatus TaxID=661399 RepID=A0A101TT42_9ACTN|nr:hypothetical protein AQJ67_28855 [Streptomyces caeruleatus]
MGRLSGAAPLWLVAQFPAPLDGALSARGVVGETSATVGIGELGPVLGWLAVAVEHRCRE